MFGLIFWEFYEIFKMALGISHIAKAMWGENNEESIFEKP